MANDFSTDDAAKGYLPLMHEFAIRSDLVSQACDGGLGLSAPFAREFSYLQFRRKCELLALGCLHLHGDLPEARQKAAQKEWHAADLLKLLKRSHPHAFPQSIVRIQTEDGWRVEANSKPEALTYEEFVSLYNECGGVLHRGSIKTVERATFSSDADYQRVVMWHQKLVTLMNEHLVVRAHSSSFYMVSLRTPSGYPECSIFHVAAPGELNLSVQCMTVSDRVLNSYVSNARFQGNSET